MIRFRAFKEVKFENLFCQPKQVKTLSLKQFCVLSSPPTNAARKHIRLFVWHCKTGVFWVLYHAKLYTRRAGSFSPGFLHHTEVCCHVCIIHSNSWTMVHGIGKTFSEVFHLIGVQKICLLASGVQQFFSRASGVYGIFSRRIGVHSTPYNPPPPPRRIMHENQN